MTQNSLMNCFVTLGIEKEDEPFFKKVFIFSVMANFTNSMVGQDNI